MHQFEHYCKRIFLIIAQNERWFPADATRPFYVRANGTKKEGRQFGSIQLWHAVLYSCRGWLQPIFITRPILRRYFSHFEKRRFFAIKAHTKKLTGQRSLRHQNKAQRKIKRAKSEKALTVFANGAHDCGLRHCSGARRFYSNSLHYTFNSTALYPCLIRMKRNAR